jgi:hypothetical protein
MLKSRGGGDIDGGDVHGPGARLFRENVVRSAGRNSPTTALPLDIVTRHS